MTDKQLRLEAKQAAYKADTRNNLIRFHIDDLLFLLDREFREEKVLLSSGQALVPDNADGDIRLVIEAQLRMEYKLRGHESLLELFQKWQAIHEQGPQGEQGSN